MTSVAAPKLNSFIIPSLTAEVARVNKELDLAEQKSLIVNGVALAAMALAAAYFAWTLPLSTALLNTAFFWIATSVSYPSFSPEKTVENLKKEVARLRQQITYAAELNTPEEIEACIRREFTPAEGAIYPEEILTALQERAGEGRNPLEALGPTLGQYLYWKNCYADTLRAFGNGSVTLSEFYSQLAPILLKAVTLYRAIVNPTCPDPRWTIRSHLYNPYPSYSQTQIALNDGPFLTFTRENLWLSTTFRDVRDILESCKNDYYRRASDPIIKWQIQMYNQLIENQLAYFREQIPIAIPVTVQQNSVA